MRKALLLLFTCGTVLHAIEFLPPNDETFARLKADPREPQIALKYFARTDGKTMGEADIGESWGLVRQEFDNGWSGQINLAGGAFARFLLGDSVNQLESIDFLGGAPIMARRGRWSTRLNFYHESNHIGDERIRATGTIPPSRFSREYVRLQQAYDLTENRACRLYAGYQYTLHDAPGGPPNAYQAGFELGTADRKFAGNHLFNVYLAQDLQWKEEAQKRTGSNTELGISIGKENHNRRFRFALSWYSGPSPRGQFARTEIEKMFGTNLYFEFD